MLENPIQSELPPDLRRERGALIARRMRITAKSPGLYIVPASTGAGSYLVEDGEDGNKSCSCPDFELRRSPCKHVWAVEYARGRETLADGSTKTTETLRVTYRQEWPAYNAAQCHEKEHVAIMIQDLCSGIPEEAQKGRGQRRLPKADRVFAMAMKVYGGMSSRRSDTDMRDYATRGLISKAPSYNSVIDYFDDASMTTILYALIEESVAPLSAVETTFAPDSTGFSTCTYKRWYDEKYGKEKSEQKWIKAHCMVGCKTNVITAVKVTDSNMNDAPELPALLATTCERFTPENVTADKGYLSINNAAVITAAGATPYIPFKKNASGNGSKSHPTNKADRELWKKLFHFFSLQKTAFLATYHKRSNAESTFSALKRKFDGALRSKTRIAQENELLCKILCFNLTMVVHAMYEFGATPSFWQISAMRETRTTWEMIELPS